MGYHMAGFEVIGIDIRPQPRYPFQFVQADALRPPFRMDAFDLIHASPPCQAYSMSRNNGCHRGAPDLIAAVRTMLLACGVPYVIENVLGAPLEFPVMLCGASFGLRTGALQLSRHRYFETSFPLLSPPCQHRPGHTIGVYGSGTNRFHRAKLGRCVTIAELREAMGINWMVRKELNQAIPPPYTEFIGREFLKS
jgi:DNA (cytosine-5)-methyltransferase 1